jgi:hypothetical protein
VVTLTFAAPEWSARGVIRGDSLDVAYNINAQLSDFEDATFVLAPAPAVARPGSLKTRIRRRAS